MYIICNYLYISGVLHPGESFWHAAALYDMCPKSTSSREGNGTPLQCSCLENARDRGAWWAAVYGVPQSQTRQKRLSSSNSSALSLGFHNIDHNPETVPPPTMSVQVSAPNLIAGSSAFEEFVWSVSNQFTDRRSTRQTQVQLLHVHTAGDSRIGGREQAEPPQAGDPPF